MGCGNPRKGTLSIAYSPVSTEVMIFHTSQKGSKPHLFRTRHVWKTASVISLEGFSILISWRFGRDFLILLAQSKGCWYGKGKRVFCGVACYRCVREKSNRNQRIMLKIFIRRQASPSLRRNRIVKSLPLRTGGTSFVGSRKIQPPLHLRRM